MSSKLEIAKTFKHWVISQVLPSKRKYGQFKLFDNPNNNTFKVENKTDLHCKVVQYIRRFYPDAIIVAGLDENQDTPSKRIQFWKKGHMKSQPDIMVLNYKQIMKRILLGIQESNKQIQSVRVTIENEKYVQKNWPLLHDKQ